MSVLSTQSGNSAEQAVRPLLSVTDLRVKFPGFASTVHAINGCSFELREGELLGLVGESGCGKSLTAAACLGLLPESAEISGSIRYRDTELLSLSQEQLTGLRGSDIAMIFQDPMTALNPYFTIGQQMSDILLHHRPALGRKQALALAEQALSKVHLPDAGQALGRYPHQFSGGQLQRIMIALALSCEPKILIADEPTTALDVTIQAQIIVLLRELAEQENLSVIFITHDLSVVASLCDRVAVMYAGRVVEQASVTELFSQPLHPYSQGLLKSVPAITGAEASQVRSELYAISGSVPDMRQPPEGCAFYQRCPKAAAHCASQQPPQQEIGQRRVACFEHQEHQTWRQQA